MKDMENVEKQLKRYTPTLTRNADDLYEAKAFLMEAPEGVSCEQCYLASDVDPLLESKDGRIAELEEGLRKIAGGLIFGEPGAPDIESPAYSGEKSINFYGDMWEWSQKVARETLGGTKS